MTHQTFIQASAKPLPGEDRKQTFGAACSCGWRGPDEPNQRRAEDDASDHTATERA